MCKGGKGIDFLNGENKFSDDSAVVELGVGKKYGDRNSLFVAIIWIAR